jgi:transcriptional regulator GlxA family with amidase domain
MQLQDDLREMEPKPADEETLAYLIAEMIILDMEEPWSIEKLALMNQIHTKKLKGIFKKYIGMPAAAFKISIRMEKARQLLLDTTLPIQEISMQVGYANPANFSTLFKQKMGISPNQLRKDSKIHHEIR